MSKILYLDTDGTKGSLPEGTLGYDAYAAGGDEGRVAVGTASGVDIPLAKKSEVDALLARELTNKVDAIIAPTVTDDSDAGYEVGSLWVDTVADEAYRCADATVGAAVWVNTTLTADELSALLISYDNTTSGLVAGTVQAAIDEVDGRLDTTETKLLGIEDGAEVNDTNTTLQGNTFNGVDQLVQLDGTGALPAIDGSNLTGLVSTSTALNTTYDNTTSGLTATNVNDAIDETNVAIATAQANASTTPLNISSQLKGDYSIVTNELVLTDGLFSISNGFVSNGVDNTILELTGSLIPTNGWSNGNDFVKVLEDGSTVATLDKPTFGEVSTTGDYLLNGKWYDKLDALYTNQFTYASKDGKLLEVEVAGGVLIDLHYNEDAPKIVENVAKFDKVIQTDNRKIIDLGTIFNNNRYVVDNPFGNENYEDCDARVEIFINSIWSETGIGNASGVSSEGRGVGAFSNAEGIVIQSGEDYICGSSLTCIGGHNSNTNTLSAPARVIVTYQGDAQ